MFFGGKRYDREASRHEPENIVATTFPLSSHGTGQQVHHTLVQRSRRRGPERVGVDGKEQGRCRNHHRDHERRRDHGRVDPSEAEECHHGACRHRQRHRTCREDILGPRSGHTCDGCDTHPLWGCSFASRASWTWPRQLHLRLRQQLQWQRFVQAASRWVQDDLQTSSRG